MEIPLDVTVLFCRACGAQGINPNDLACREQHHDDICHVHYEIAASQSSPVAQERVVELRRHGHRLLSDEGRA